MSAFTSERLRERTFVTRVILALVFLILTGAFFRTQVVEVSAYRLQSQKNRLRQVMLLAPRGEILDRDGRVIADNVPGYTVKLFTPSRDSLRAVLDRLSQVVVMDSGSIEAVVRRYQQAPYQPAVVFTGAPFETVSRLEEHRYALPGLVIQTEPKRIYTGGRAVAHLVGYVGEVSEEELKRDRFATARMGSIVGRDGLEEQYDSELRGTDGVQFTEVDARGRMVREEVATASLAPIRGLPVRTTIDLPLQLYIDSLWNAAEPGTRGSMIAMTPSGEILALYSAPAFDPNDFIGGIPLEKWDALMNDDAKPLMNRAVRGTYPPASTFKLALAVMALRRGVATFDTKMPEPCRGGFQYGNRFFRCWKPEGHGSLDLAGAIRFSCDAYFYQLGLRLGLPYVLEEGEKMGFGDRTGVDLGHEIRPLWPANTAYYDRLRGPRGWTNAVTLNLSIGQGENSQTLINMMRFYAALAGDGTLEAPYLVRRSDTTHDLAGARFGSSWPDSAKRFPEWCSGGPQPRAGVAKSTWRERPARRRIPTAPTTAGSSGSRPPITRKSWSGASWNSKLHGTVVAPYVAQVIKRYLAERHPAMAKAPVRFSVVEDSVIAPVDIGPDTLPDTSRASRPPGGGGATRPR